MHKLKGLRLLPCILLLPVTRGETTLAYAQAVNAREARRLLKFRYG